MQSLAVSCSCHSGSVRYVGLSLFYRDKPDVTGGEVTWTGHWMNKSRAQGSGLSGSSFLGCRSGPVGMDTKD